MTRFTHILLPMRRVHDAPGKQNAPEGDRLQSIRIDDRIAYEIAFKRNDYIWLVSRGMLVGYVRILRLVNGKHWYAYFYSSSAVTYPRRKRLKGYWSGRLRTKRVQRWLAEIRLHAVTIAGPT